MYDSLRLASGGGLRGLTEKVKQAENTLSLRGASCATVPYSQIGTYLATKTLETGKFIKEKERNYVR